MNRALFITIGIVAIIFVFIVWLYLFLNGSPVNTNQVFSDLGIIEATERTMEPESSLDTNRGTTLNLTDGTIQQLTTEPVAGFGTASSSSGTVLRYVERGTGYIQEVNLRSGLKNQVTPHTTPGAVAAHFSPNLQAIVVTSNKDKQSITLVTIANTTNAEVTITELPNTAKNLMFVDDDTLFYTRGNYTQTVGYHYNLDDGEVKEQFKVSLPDATVVVTPSGEYYAYPKPAATLIGAAYKITGNALSPIGEPALGLVPYMEDSVTIITSITTDGSGYVSQTDLSDAVLPHLILPEKCAADSASNLIWCGAPQTQTNKDYLENWYKGLVISDDTITQLDTVTGEVVTLSVPKVDTGRQVDVVSMLHVPETGRLLFINKIDATLWSFDL